MLALLHCSRFVHLVVKEENILCFSVSTLTGIDFSEGVPAGTHLLEVVALGYFFPPVSQVYIALLLEFAISILIRMFSVLFRFACCRLLK